MINIRVYDGQITKNFNIKEFKCRANGEVLLNEDVISHIVRLQKFREWYGRTMKINSGYRTTTYNSKIGGAPKSKHMQGIATDFALPLKEFSGYSQDRKNEFLDNVKEKWYQLCEEDGVQGGVGFYDTFIHLDSRTDRQAFWNMRNK
ncbi:MAG: D-Ala-D-Ala carboxypeptidase family metallohydrolase [Anaeromicrobium sp.]|jgi:uncharacterized protein YcbK (DUF882 family)|uniref:YcbK family protein n=1 Tax=Anaeromicrobium sp. TaxID=1929132 RepID=UPI0025E9CA40|nr:D-Ala-D-Ala carboxypeptidase family metallohydrolase [Anaeromicrobium sp.]MCT4593195.1 D-Ala-D-Ala carboxypeptidase family metallohydrolase [Anaeromicrobium sp.]